MDEFDAKENDETPADSESGPEADVRSDEVRLLSNPKAWLILAGIFVVIAVAVLYVYQAGDTKTVLGNQPIPAQQPMAYAQPAALNVSGGGGVLPVTPVPSMPAPFDRLAQAGVAPPPPAMGFQGPSAVRCPQCGTDGVPLCSSCGAVMRPLQPGSNSGLFSCPSCGSVGVVICPRCGAQMTSANAGPGQQYRPSSTGGQFHCSACGATGLPNWDPNGTPICPSCGATMHSHTQTQSAQLAAAP